MNPYIFLAIFFSAFAASPAYAWRCGQKCPTNLFSGKLECQAHNAACSVPRPRLPRVPETQKSGFGHVPNYSQHKIKDQISKINTKVDKARRRRTSANPEFDKSAYARNIRAQRDKRQRRYQAELENKQRAFEQAAEDRRRQQQFQREERARRKQEQKQQQMGAAHELGKGLGSLFKNMLAN